MRTCTSLVALTALTALAACRDHAMIAAACDPGADAACVAAGPTCGSGTTEVDLACLGPTRFEIRAPAQAIADGYHPVGFRVFAFGPDGAPVRERLVATLDRATAGTVTSAVIDTGDLGGAAAFLPCAATSTGCVGDATLSIARADAPDVAVASTRIVLVAPPPIASIAPCDGADDVFHVEATNFAYDGVHEIRGGTWEVFGAENRVVVQAVQSPGDNGWRLEVHTIKLGLPLFPTVFSDATYPAPYGRPHFTLSLSAPTHPECNSISAFQVHDVAVTPGVYPVIDAATVSFAQTCPEYPDRGIRGCVRYVR